MGPLSTLPYHRPHFLHSPHSMIPSLPPPPALIPLPFQALLEIDIVMSSSLFMLITYYSVMTDTNEHD